MMSEKEKLLTNKDVKAITYLVLAIELPNGAKELITNTNNIEEKLSYIDSAYDENLVMKNNSNIRILEWMVV